MATEEASVQKKGPCNESRAQRVCCPAADLYETLEEYGLVVNVPGVGPNDAKVTVERGVLTIQAPSQVDVPHGMRIIHREFAGGSFGRSFRIPEGADSASIRACLQNGQLTIVLPKKAETRSRRISLNAEG